MTSLITVEMEVMKKIVSKFGNYVKLILVMYFTLSVWTLTTLTSNAH